jgi:hypothetical protein
MQRVVMLSVSVAIVAWGASAFADSPNLKGDYGFIENDWCIYAGDFTAPPHIRSADQRSE